ncbi:unnamed protein product [Closterium sp. Naga37s-1]|nr:unnamed protein product [Closterium sp. Naga37s-1]
MHYACGTHALPMRNAATHALPVRYCATVLLPHVLVRPAFTSLSAFLAWQVRQQVESRLPGEGAGGKEVRQQVESRLPGEAAGGKEVDGSERSMVVDGEEGGKGEEARKEQGREEDGKGGGEERGDKGVEEGPLERGGEVGNEGEKREAGDVQLTHASPSPSPSASASASASATPPTVVTPTLSPPSVSLPASAARATSSPSTRAAAAAAAGGATLPAASSTLARVAQEDGFVVDNEAPCKRVRRRPRASLGAGLGPRKVNLECSAGGGLADAAAATAAAAAAAADGSGDESGRGGGGWGAYHRQSAQMRRAAVSRQGRAQPQPLSSSSTTSAVEEGGTQPQPQPQPHPFPVSSSTTTASSSPPFSRRWSTGASHSATGGDGSTFGSFTSSGVVETSQKSLAEGNGSMFESFTSSGVGSAGLHASINPGAVTAAGNAGLEIQTRAGSGSDCGAGSGGEGASGSGVAREIFFSKAATVSAVPTTWIGSSSSSGGGGASSCRLGDFLFGATREAPPSEFPPRRFSDVGSLTQLMYTWQQQGVSAASSAVSGGGCGGGATTSRGYDGRGRNFNGDPGSGGSGSGSSSGSGSGSGSGTAASESNGQRATLRPFPGRFSDISGWRRGMGRGALGREQGELAGRGERLVGMAGVMGRGDGVGRGEGAGRRDGVGKGEHLGLLLQQWAEDDRFWEEVRRQRREGQGGQGSQRVLRRGQGAGGSAGSLRALVGGPARSEGSVMARLEGGGDMRGGRRGGEEGEELGGRGVAIPVAEVEAAAAETAAVGGEERDGTEEEGVESGGAVHQGLGAVVTRASVDAGAAMSVTAAGRAAGGSPVVSLLEVPATPGGSATQGAAATAGACDTSSMHSKERRGVHSSSRRDSSRRDSSCPSSSAATDAATYGQTASPYKQSPCKSSPLKRRPRASQGAVNQSGEMVNQSGGMVNQSGEREYGGRWSVSSGWTGTGSSSKSGSCRDSGIVSRNASLCNGSGSARRRDRRGGNEEKEGRKGEGGKAEREGEGGERRQQVGQRKGVRRVRRRAVAEKVGVVGQVQRWMDGLGPIAKRVSASVAGQASECDYGGAGAAMDGWPGTYRQASWWDRCSGGWMGWDLLPSMRVCQDGLAHSSSAHDSFLSTLIHTHHMAPSQVLAIGGVAVLAAAVFIPRRPRQHVEALTPLQVAQRMR